MRQALCWAQPAPGMRRTHGRQGSEGTCQGAACSSCERMRLLMSACKSRRPCTPTHAHAKATQAQIMSVWCCPCQALTQEEHDGLNVQLAQSVSDTRVAPVTHMASKRSAKAGSDEPSVCQGGTCQPWRRQPLFGCLSLVMHIVHKQVEITNRHVRCCAHVSSCLQLHAAPKHKPCPIINTQMKHPHTSHSVRTWTPQSVARLSPATARSGRRAYPCRAAGLCFGRGWNTHKGHRLATGHSIDKVLMW